MRKDCDQVKRAKKNLKGLNPNDLDFSEGTRLFINDNLCPYYTRRWNKCKKLWINKKIFSLLTVNGRVPLKLEQDCSYNSFTHLNELKSFLPKNFVMSST